MTASANKKTSICLVAHYAYDAMASTNKGQIGGVEWQTSLTARWLADRGYDVSMVTWDEGHAPEKNIDGVRMIALCRRFAGIRGLRFLYPRWTSLNQALKRADADVYYHNCGEYVTGQVALWARRHGRAFVYSVANDTDCDAALPEMKTIRDRWLYRYGLQNADAVIAQTIKQQHMLDEGFRRESVVIPMPCLGPGDDEFQPPEPPHDERPRILWLARVTRQKRPDRLLEVARLCPDYQFDLVGPADESQYAQDVLQQARAVPNIVVHGRAEREQLPDLYRQSACFLCTSDFEGFPNTFLEAWSYGLPIVSTFDPDGVIADRDLGEITAGAAGVAEGLRTMLSQPLRWRQCSAAARAYFYDNHRVEAVLPRFERIFEEAAAAHGRTQAAPTERRRARLAEPVSQR